MSDPLLSLSPSSVDPETKYVKVKPTLQIVDSEFPHVFSIGDVADTGAHKAARPAIAQAQIVLRNIQKLMKDEKAELDTYKPDPPAIHLALGFVSDDWTFSSKRADSSLGSARALNLETRHRLMESL